MDIRTVAASVLAGVFAFAASSNAGAAAHAPATWGQHLVDVALHDHPDVYSIVLHVTPPKGSDNVIVASNIGRIGKKADADDLQVLKTGRSRYEVNKTTGRFSVEESLQDVSGAAIGVLAVSFPAGSDTARDRAEAAEIQRFFSAHVISTANVMDAYPYSSAYSPKNAAQALVEHTMARHPELIVLGMHVSLPNGRNVFLGSNIGRIGKLADDDDMRVVNTGRSNFEVSSDKRRYEVELVLEDQSGKNIGALGTVFRYTGPADKAKWNARAIAIRDEMAKQIPSAVSLLKTGKPLVADGVTSLGAYHGDFDHFAVDLKDRRLFLAGEDGAALEVFDLQTGEIVQSLKGFGVPHSPVLLNDTNALLIVDGERPSQIRNASTLALERTISLPKGADSVAYDSSTRHLWVVTGGKDVAQRDSNLIEIDPATGKIFHTVHFDANHVEALAVENDGDRLFINVTDKNEIAVVNKQAGKVMAWWRVREARENAPMALDEANHRLFIVTRKPGMLLVLNADTGATIAHFGAPARADDVVWDPTTRRIYVPGGDGFIGVYQQTSADSYSELARIPSRAGAKTAALVPSLQRLFLAASPGDTDAGGALLRFDIVP